MTSPTGPLSTALPLYSKRLELRAVQVADLPQLMDVNGDPEVTRFLPYETWHSPDAGQAWFERMAAMAQSGSAIQMVIVEKSLNRVIGTCLIFAYDQGSSRAEIGYALGRAYWRKGLMTEALQRLIEWAFGDLDLRRLEAQVDPQNVPSNLLLTKAGFTREGTLRERWVTKGRMCDTNMYGLLRKDW